MTVPIALIGIGNILFTDDGVGVYAVKAIEENYSVSPAIEIIDGGTLGFKLLDLLADYEKVIIVDTISIDARAGNIFSMPGQALCDIGTLRQTAHEVEVVEMLKMAELFQSSAEVVVIGMVPEDTNSVAFNLSPPVKDNFDRLQDQILKQLQIWGIVVESKANLKSLEAVIDSFQTGVS